MENMESFVINWSIRDVHCPQTGGVGGWGGGGIIYVLQTQFSSFKAYKRTWNL